MVFRPRALLGDPGAGEIGETLLLRDANTAAFQDLAIAGRSDEAHRSMEPQQRFDPRFAARRDEVISGARQPDPCELLLHRFGGSRSVGEQHDATPLAPPLRQPLGRAGVEVHPVVDHAPDVAEDQPVLRVE